MPHQTGDREGRFKKGHQKMGGRQPGMPNKVSRDLRTVHKLDGCRALCGGVSAILTIRLYHLTRYGFAATEGRGRLMDWARILAFVTGTVDQELLARIEYLAAEKSHPEIPVEGAAEALGRRSSHSR
jgi:hypothetical protein